MTLRPIAIAFTTHYDTETPKVYTRIDNPRKVGRNCMGVYLKHDFIIYNKDT